MRRVFLSRKSDKLKLYTVIGMLLGGETAEGVHYPSETRNFECIYKLSGLKTLHLYSVSALR